MNDAEQPPHSDEPSNETRSTSGPIPTDATLMQDVKARRLLIAAALREEDPSARATVAWVVREFHTEIAQARAEHRSWNHVAEMLSEHAVAATPDAVRMAFRRIASRKKAPGARAPIDLVRLPLANPTSTLGQKPDPSSPAYRPNITRRIR